MAQLILGPLQRFAGEEDVAHWHFPDFESCLEIVPLGDRRAVSLSLQRRQRRLRYVAAASFAGMTVTSGLAGLSTGRT